MAQVSFRGMCKGTETKTSQKTGNPYKITSFVDMDTFKTFEVFGDLGLSPDTSPKQYVLSAVIGSLNSVTVHPEQKPK